jgi:phospholipase/carboxylesterase
MKADLPRSTAPDRAFPVRILTASLLLLAACSRSQPPAPPATPTPPPASAAQPPAAPSQPPDIQAPPSRPAAARAPRTPLLIERAGDPTGPIGYLVLEPANPAPDLPVVIALHGRGDRAEQFARLAEGLQVPVRFVVARAPLPFGPGAGKQWFDSDSPDVAEQIAARVEELVVLTDRVRAAWPAAPKPILLGFSQGAMLAIQSVARHPDRYAAAVALSGFLPLDQGNAKAAAAVPMLLTAGSNDSLVSPERTKLAVTALEALGHQPELLEFDGGHTIPRAAVARTRAFLREHAKLPPVAPPEPASAPSP